MHWTERTGVPAVSHVIPTRNRPRLVVDCVLSILKGNHVPDEIIVVDQSDYPNTVLAAMEREENHVLRYCPSSSTGSSRARNEGIRAARYPITVFTDDDVLVTADWLESLVAALLAGGPRSVVTGRVLPGEPEVPGGFAPSTVVSTSPVMYKGRIGADVLFPNNMALWRTTFDDIGLFDPVLGPGTACPAAEDNDMAFRLLESGYRIVYAPTAVLHHRAWRAAPGLLRIEWDYAVGQGAFYAKYLSFRDRYMLRRFAKDIFIRCRQLLATGRRGDIDGMRIASINLVGLAFGLYRWHTSNLQNT